MGDKLVGQPFCKARVAGRPEGHSRQAKRLIRLTLGAGPHALHGDLSMTAPQSSGTEAIRAGTPTRGYSCPCFAGTRARALRV